MREYFVWLFKLLTLVGIFFVVIPLLVAVIAAVSAGDLNDGVGNEKHTVAVLELTGIIDDSRKILEDLHKQVANKKVKAIVLRIDSPGGAVGPSQDIYAAVKRLKDQKPIVASMGSVAASGGLYAALGASKVFSQPGTITGSIGVIMQVPNFQKVSEKLGVDVITIKSGKLKDVGNSFRQMTDEERVFLETTVAKAHEDFIEAVAVGRGIEIAKVREFADGRVILGADAKGLRLVDEFGDVYQAAHAALALAGVTLTDQEQPKLFYPEDKFGQFKQLIEGVTHFTQNLSRSVAPSAGLQYLMY